MYTPEQESRALDAILADIAKLDRQTCPTCAGGGWVPLEAAGVVRCECQPEQFDEAFFGSR